MKKPQVEMNYEKAEELVKNITIPNSQFRAVWTKEKGYCVGYESIQLTKHYETLDEALNQIGYGAKRDEQGEDILEKYGHVDFELIMRMIQAVIVLNQENNNLANLLIENDEKNN